MSSSPTCSSIICFLPIPLPQESTQEMPYGQSGLQAAHHNQIAICRIPHYQAHEPLHRYLNKVKSVAGFYLQISAFADSRLTKKANTSHGLAGDPVAHLCSVQPGSQRRAASPKCPLI